MFTFNSILHDWRTARRRSIVAVAVLAVATLAACGGGSDSAAEEGQSISLGVDSDNFMANLPLYIAKDKGYFADAGLTDVEIVQTGDNYAAGLISGSVDISFASTASWFAAGEQSGEELRWLGPLRDTEYISIGARKGIETADDLKGKKVTGGPVGDDNDANLREGLKGLGLSESDVEIVPTDPGSDAWLAAVLAGQLDAALMFPRHVQPLEENGGSIIFKDLRDAPQDGYAATQKFLDADPDAVKAFFVGMLKARDFYWDPSNKDEVYKIMKDNGFDPDVVDPAWDLELDQHPIDGGFSAEAMTSMIDRNKDREQVSADLNWTEWVDLTALWAAQKEMGLELRPTADEVSANS